MSGLYRKAGSTFILKFFGLGIAFVFQIILGRILAPELYGEYTMYLTYSTIISIITILGMDRNLIKEIAKLDNNEFKCIEILKFSIMISMIIILIISLLVLIMKKYIGLTKFGYILLISMITVKSLIALLDGYLQGKGLVVEVTILNSVLNNILKMIFFIFLIAISLDSLNAALISFIGSELMTIALRFKKVNKLVFDDNNLIVSFKKKEKKMFLKYSVTVALISGIGILLQSVDKIIIATYLDLSSVGIYKVAQNYVGLISVFVTPFIAFWPVISKLYSQNNIEQIEIEMKKIIRIVTYLVIPMFYIFLFLGNDLLLIFGEEYVTKEAKLTLIILASSFLIDAISGPIGSILTMTKYAKFVLYNNIGSLFINIILNLILIGKYGIVGVAISTGISIIVNNLISIIQVKLLLGIFSYDYRNLIQVVSMGILNYLFGVILIERITLEKIYINIIIFGIIIYGLNLIVLGITQRKNIGEILNRRI